MAACLLALPLGWAPSASATVQKHDWLIAQSSLDRIQKLAPNLVQAYFDAGSTLVLGVPPKGWAGSRVEGFTSEAKFAATLAAGHLARGVKAVLYDNERWSLTPAAEQAAPATFEARFAALAHAHSLIAIMAPAVDLVAGLKCAGRTQAAMYLSCGLAKSAASAGDVLDIQAQRFEGDPAAYAALVTAAAAQARSAKHSVVVLAGLSTDLGNAHPSSGQLVQAAKLSRSTVSGWWLNIPGTSARCPNCPPADPSLAVQFLTQLDAGSV